ncbi:MAG TPA: L-histidine N(alpha)-methyltransferase [Blastocatellia bacterium]|nr:L-histidine N(alpha)-methyltransferase [Blastocatellia bacterium]
MLSTTGDAKSDRLIIHRLEDRGDLHSFARDVREGLKARPRFLLPKYFYDDLGSKLFEAICRLPEYYLTRAESEILRNYSNEIIGAIEGPARLLELGSGSAEKTRHLIEALLGRQSKLVYMPVDISGESLERSSAELLRIYPQLSITAFAADYFTALGHLARSAPSLGEEKRTVAVFLGSNIGNFDPDEAKSFLRKVRLVLGSRDSLLLGADLKKSPDVLVPAYDDALGVTSAFNRNLLARINRELGGDFDVKKFDHLAVYNEEQGRMEIYLVSREPQTARVRAVDLEIHFERGEAIHTENSYKFDLAQLAEFGRQSGFDLVKTWLDSARRFSFNLFRAV